MMLTLHLRVEFGIMREFVSLDKIIDLDIIYFALQKAESASKIWSLTAAY